MHQTPLLRLSIQQAFVQNGLAAASEQSRVLAHENLRSLPQMLTDYETVARTELLHQEQSSIRTLMSHMISLFAIPLARSQERQAGSELIQHQSSSLRDMLLTLCKELHAEGAKRVRKREESDYTPIATRYQASFGTVNKEELV